MCFVNEPNLLLDKALYGRVRGRVVKDASDIYEQIYLAWTGSHEEIQKEKEPFSFQMHLICIIYIYIVSKQ